MTAAQERELLAPFLERASTGGILVVGQVKTEIEARLGRLMALSSVYCAGPSEDPDNWAKSIGQTQHATF